MANKNVDPRFRMVLKRSEQLQKSFWETLVKNASPKEVQTAFIERMFFEIAFLQTTIAEIKGILQHGTADDARNELLTTTGANGTGSNTKAAPSLSVIGEKMD